MSEVASARLPAKHDPRAIVYTPAEELLQFHNSEAFIRLVCGSPGGGKTVACLMEIMFLAMRQEPGHDGVRRHRALIVRETYARLRTTVMKTVNDWYPSECGAVKLTAPMEGLYTIPQPDGTTVRLELLMLALDDEASLQAMRSLEFSSAYLNEINEQDRAVLNIVVERVGRYPAAKDGALCSEPCIIGDFNTVSKEHWLYDACVAAPMPGLDFIMQKPAVLCHNHEEWWGAPGDSREGGRFSINPAAPNLSNLPANYYENMLNTYTKRQIASLLMLQWVSAATGKLVHPEFSRKDHVALERTKPVRGETIMVGIDTSGLHPAAVFAQVQAGTLVVMDEVFGDGVAFEQFITTMLLPIVAARYAGHEIVASTDPSNPRDARTGVTPNQLLMQYKIVARSASTNKFDLRREAVSKLLNRRGGVVIDPQCKRLIHALEEGYVFKKLKGSASTTGVMYSAEPSKNEASHIADAMQYLCLPLARTGDEAGHASPVKVKRRRTM